MKNSYKRVNIREVSESTEKMEIELTSKSIDFGLQAFRIYASLLKSDYQAEEIKCIAEFICLITEIDIKD